MTDKLHISDFFCFACSSPLQRTELTTWSELKCLPYLLAKLPQEGGCSPLRVIFMQKSFRILEELKGNNGCYKNGGGGMLWGLGVGFLRGCWGRSSWSWGVLQKGSREPLRYLGLEEDTEPQTWINFRGPWPVDGVTSTPGSGLAITMCLPACPRRDHGHKSGPTRLLSYLPGKVFCWVNMLCLNNRQKNDFGYWQYYFTENLELHK